MEEGLWQIWYWWTFGENCFFFFNLISFFIIKTCGRGIVTYLVLNDHLVGTVFIYLWKHTLFDRQHFITYNYSPITFYVINILNHVFYSSPVECYWWHEKTWRRKLFQDCSPFSCIFIWLVNLLDFVLYFISYIFLYCGNINLMGQCKSSTIRSHWFCF